MITAYEDRLLVVEDVWKTFPGVTALKGVSLDIREGEILGLLGENGAGKSTLLKILFGVIKPDRGRIIWQGKEIKPENPIHAMQLGMFYVPQELLIPRTISVAEMLSLGVELKGVWKRVNYKRLYEDARNVLSLVGLEDLDPKTRMDSLDVPSQQLVLVSRALLMKAKLITLDEPTSALGPEEVNRLLKLMVKLKESGVSFIFVSHRIEEVLQVADRLVVIRDGKKVGEFDNSKRDVNPNDVIKTMIAREIKEFYPKEFVPKGEIVLEVKGLSGKNVKDVSFSAREGEILGIFGLLGSGALEIPKVMLGLLPRVGGEIYVHGKHVKIEKPSDALKYGIVYVPEDRRKLGLIPLMSAKSNMTLTALDLFSRVKLGLLSLINTGKEKETAGKLVEQLKVSPPEPNRLAMYFSGGNQQKVLVARAFTRPSKVIIFSEPTIGIDVGAKVEIRRLMVDLAKKGNAIILISSDVHEIFGMADKIIVVNKGRKVSEISRDEASVELLMKAAAIGG